MLRNLVLYNNENGYEAAFRNYIKEFEVDSSNDNSFNFYLPDKNELLAIDIDKYFEGSANTILFSCDQNGNTALASLYSDIAPVIGNQRYSFNSDKYPDVFILFKPDVLQMFFLKNFMKEANFNLHLFMPKSDYSSNNLFISLKDWIPFMDFKTFEM